MEPRRDLGPMRRIKSGLFGARQSEKRLRRRAAHRPDKGLQGVGLQFEELPE
jgi:hypothetical protein